MSSAIAKISLKNVFIILCACLLILMPALGHNFGQNGDEDVEIVYGKDIWNYYLHSDKQALNYDHATNTNLKGMEFYGGQFDVITEGVQRMFPSWYIINIRHFFSALFGALLIFFTGLLAYRLSNKNWGMALLSAVFLLFSPRIFGESMSNGKDIPFAMGFTMGIYYLVRILQDFPTRKNMWKEALLLALAWGIAFGMRSAGGLLFAGSIAVTALIYFIVNKDKRALLFQNNNQILKRLLLYFVVAFVAGYIFGVLTWPFALETPSNIFVALKEMTNRSVGLRVLFEGKYYNSMKMPWYYELKWILISNPVIILLCLFAFIVLIMKARKMFGTFTVLLLLFNALFPLFYMIYKHSTVYDSWRHVFFVYPYWVIMAALSIPLIKSLLPEKLQLIPVAIVVLGLLPAVFWTVSAHPNQYIYFNEIEGGTKGAFGNYDLDYYLTSGKQSADWILKNVPKPPNGEKLRVLSNMDGMDNYFRKDTSWVYSSYCRYYERDQKDWDYYVTYGRFVSLYQLQNGKWPPANVVYTVYAGGMPVGVVLKRKSHDDFKAYQALQKNDFANAAMLYANYLKTDTSNEMVYCNYGIALASMGKIDEGIAALKTAISLNADQFNFYQILSQVYKAKGDMQNAQNILIQGQARMVAQDEDSEN